MTGHSRKLAIAAGLRPESSQRAPGENRADAFPIGEAQTSGDQSQSSDAAALAAVARAEYASRRRRDGLFRKSLFAEPAWDMLLDLFAQRHERRAVSVHSLCIAAAVPQTTALRWINKLAEIGLVERRPCPHDNRVIHISLSEEGLAIMERYLRGQLGTNAIPARPGPAFS